MSAGYPLPGERPGELRWLVEPSTFADPGAVLALGSLAWPHWLDSLQVVSHRELLLRSDRDWAGLSQELWSVLPDALAQRESWTIVPDAAQSAECSADERLCAAVHAVLSGELGAFVASHGGRIELVDAHDGVVRVKLAGACSGCSLADVTIRLRLERDLRLAAGPDFTELVATRA